MYKLAIFDLDGTILYTLEDLMISVNAGLSQCGFPTCDLPTVERILGNGVENLMRSTIPEGSSEEDFQKALQGFKTHYAVHCMDRTKPYDGIPELFDRLHAEGYLVAVLSNKRNEPVQDLMKHYFDGQVDLAFGERDGIRRKPAPDAILAMMEHFQVAPADTVYIGDSEVDVEAARNAGIDSILCEWGYRSYADLVRAGAETIVSSVEELAENLLAE